MRKNFVIAAAAASVLTGVSSSAMAAYSVITTFTPPNGAVSTTTYPWSNPIYWSAGVPTATSVATVGPIYDPLIGPTALAANTAAAQSVDANLTAYGINLIPSHALVVSQANNASLTLLSEDSVVDAATNRAPAIQSINPTQQTNFRVPIVLGDASLAAGAHTAYIIHRGTAGSLQIGNKISEFAGQTWGLTIGSTDTTISDYREVNMRGDSNGNNYLLNRLTITGQVTVLAKNNLRLTNNVLNYGVGLPDYVVDGTIARALNAGAIVLNAVDGTGQITQTSGGGNREVFIGANNGTGTFSGAINNSSMRVFKIGSGSQSLGSGTSTTATAAAATTPIVSNQLQNWAVEGTLVAPALASLGQATSVTTLDGGTLSYTGAGETTTTRVFNLSFRGGTLSSDNAAGGALVINGGGTAVMTPTNVTNVAGDASVSGTSQTVQNVYGLNGLSQYVGKMTLTTAQQSTIATNNIFTINEGARTIDLGTGNTVNQAAGGSGAPVFTFTASQAIDRTLTLSGVNTADNTLGVVLANEATLGAKLGVTKSGPGTWVLTGANTYTGTTTVTGGRLKATLPAHAPILTGAGGADVQSGSLVLDYTGGGSPVAQVKSILDAGYAGNFATGQIRGTNRAANTTIGYGDNGTAVTVRVTLPGDAELDGDVDFNDFLVLQNNFAQANTRFDQANFNYDGFTDFNDFLALQNFFGQSVSGDAVAFSDAQVAALTAFAANPLNQAVPEPASLALIGLGAAGLMGRRRRA